MQLSIANQGLDQRLLRKTLIEIGILHQNSVGCSESDFSRRTTLGKIDLGDDDMPLL